MLDRRLQIRLDTDRRDKVFNLARMRGLSVAAIVREAIDRLPDSMEERRIALDAIFAAAPMEVPDEPMQLREEIRRDRDSRWQ